MEIKVLGPGCPKCNHVGKAVRKTLEESGVSDMLEMAKYGIFGTPAVVIDGEVKCAGKVLKKDEILKWIKG